MCVWYILILIAVEGTRRDAVLVKNKSLWSRKNFTVLSVWGKEETSARENIRAEYEMSASGIPHWKEISVNIILICSLLIRISHKTFLRILIQYK